VAKTSWTVKLARIAAVGATFFVSFEFCAPAVKPVAPLDGSSTDLRQLWEAPANPASADMGYGPWGRALAPDPDATYTFEHRKSQGASPGLTVRDPSGRKWSVKQGQEGPVEVMHSRILSALGYHQPPVYYLPAFTVTDEHGTRRERGGRFRPSLKELDEIGDWSWQQNPFVGTKPYQGLLVIMRMFEGNDLKNSNNSLYEHTRRDGSVERWYVVRDIGNALGDTGRYDSEKNDPGRFERQPFVSGVENGFVVFPYSGWHQELYRGRITPADVRWACELLSRLTDRQWDAAFKSGGYDPATAARFKKAIQTRIAQAGQLATSN
jgi:hypothetical protein